MIFEKKNCLDFQVFSDTFSDLIFFTKGMQLPSIILVLLVGLRNFFQGDDGTAYYSNV